MKKIKLLALAAFAMLSTNVFAADAYLVKAGLVFKYDDTAMSTDSKNPQGCTLAGVKKVLVNGNPSPAASYEIPASFDKEFQNENTYYFKVTGCENGWETKTVTLGDAECMAVGDMTSLTLNVDNWAAAAFTGYEYGSLAKLTTLVIADGKKVKTARTVANLQLTAAVKASLTTLDIADVNITALGNADFQVVAEGAWDKLTTITLPTALTTIGTTTDAAGVFPGFKGTTISIPSKVTIIGANAFKGAALTGITFETDDKSKTSLTTIGASAFEGCEALASIALPAEVTSIGNSAFKGCVKLATAAVPGELVAAGLGESAFEGCVLLEEIDLSAAQITTLEDNVFKGCEKLATITLPETVATIDAGAFEGTIVATINAPGCTSFNVNALGAAAANRAENKTLTTVVLGAPAVATGAYTFANCTALENVTIAFADIANAINANFFYGCTKLAAFKWDATTNANASINNDAFNKCTPNVVISTSNIYIDAFPSAPKFCVYATAAAKTFKTVADASGAAAAYGLIYDAANNLAVKAEDAKVYSVYVDVVDKVAYFTALMPSGGKYYVPAGSHCILKTDEAKAEIPVTYEAGGAGVPYDNVFTVTADTEYATFLSGVANTVAFGIHGIGTTNVGANVDDEANACFADRGNYLYRLSNNGSFGFNAYKKKLKAGQYFILLKTQPAAGRLQTVWLDENGNVEGEATAINSIVEKSQNAGVTYNLAGQKVKAGYKGVVIRNGKKMILK